MRDGSIPIHEGFEMVTHAMSYDWAMRYFPWELLDELKRLGVTGDGLGLHVHVSRAGFGSPEHIARWMTFIHRNAGYVTALARRSSVKYAGFTDSDRRAIPAYAQGSRDGKKMRAINVRLEGTFELRMFASTLERDEVQAALGFATASIEYTRTLSVPGGVADGEDWPAFTT